jgi:hypothetical protein
MGKKYSLSNLTVRLHGGKNMCGPWGWWLCDGKPLHGSLNKRNSPWPKNEWNIDIPTCPEEDSDVGLKPRHLNRMGFWKTLNDVSSKMNSQMGQLSKKAMTHNWCYFSTGGGHCHIEVALNSTKHYVSVYYFTTSHDVYNKMNSVTAKIESICGKRLTWNISNTQKRFSATLGVKIPGLDFNNIGNYPDLAKQTIETVEAMKQAYQKVILHSKGNQT